MKIGTLTLEHPLILAPLAGVTHLPFRLLAREAGCALVCSEMVSADGLVHGAPNTLGLLRSDPAEKPLSIQIFGSDPSVMAEAAAVVENSGADVLDINFGCAVRKVTKIGAGVALMQSPKRVEALLRAVRKKIRIPLTVKIRSGWDASGRQALAVGEIAEACGVDAVTIHPRTAAQMFSGRADWTIIAALKRRLSLPVVGNGDIFSAEDAERMFAQTGCDAVMVGRAAIGCPSIFARILSRFEGRPQSPEGVDGRLDLMRRYVEISVACFGAERAGRLIRHRLGWFAKGIPHSAPLRQALGGADSIDQALALIEGFREEAARRRRGPGPAVPPGLA
jgi:nifR3 family TIM-barrel protein